MNKKGISTIFGLMLAITIIILGLALAGPMSSIFEEIRGPNTNSSLGLDCGNTSISDFQQAGCVASDLFTPLFLGTLIAIGGAILGARMFFGGGG